MKFFNDRNEYKYFLMNKMNELQHKEEYNIFAHIITVFSKDVQFYKKSEEEISNNKASKI